MDIKGTICLLFLAENLCRHISGRFFLPLFALLITSFYMILTVFSFV